MVIHASQCVSVALEARETDGASVAPTVSANRDDLGASVAPSSALRGVSKVRDFVRASWRVSTKVGYEPSRH